ncbi:MAG: O-antigen ligase family protein, partial [Clostridiales bacterium]|nr:O-antigen ligase family protein [Clostridiales bacterium]
CMPITFYLVYKSKYGFLYMLAVAVELFCIFATSSRASLVVALPGIAIVSVALCFKKKTGRLGYWIVFGVAVAAAVAVVIVFRNSIFGKIADIFGGNIGDSGRFKLWGWGARAWTDYPMFGYGFTYIEKFGGYKGAYNHSFHCTPLTYLYSTGIFGLGAYIYHRYKTVRLTFSAKLTSERVFVALSVLAMLCNALLDVGMNTQQLLLYYSILLALIEHDVRFVKTSEAASNNK